MAAERYPAGGQDAQVRMPPTRTLNQSWKRHRLTASCRVGGTPQLLHSSVPSRVMQIRGTDEFGGRAKEASSLSMLTAMEGHCWGVCTHPRPKLQEYTSSRVKDGIFCSISHEVLTETSFSY